MNEQIKRLQDDFVAFLFVLWQALNLPRPTRCQIDMARTLAKGEHKRFILQAFRGIGKSFITCAFVVWKLWNNPQLKIEIVSASKDRADANSIFVRRIIDLLPFLHDLKPKEGQRDSVIVFDVGGAKPDHSPSVKSVGITGQLTGSRADIIIADDVETPNNSATQHQRDRLGELVKEFDAILKPDEHCQIIYLGTPQTEMTLYRELEQRGYKTLIWPARYPRDEKDLLTYGDRIAPMLLEDLNGLEEVWWQPTDPIRFDEDDLNDREISYGRGGFALQFQLNPSISDEGRYPLKLRDLIVSALDNEAAPLTYQWLPNAQNAVQDVPVMGLKGDSFHRPHVASESVMGYQNKILVIDPSGRGKDETGYCVLYTLNGYIYLMDVGGIREGYEEPTLNKLALIAKRWKVNEVVFESNFGDGMWGKVFQPVLIKHHPCTMTEFRSKGQKEVRIIENLEPVMSSHRFVVRDEVIRQEHSTARDVDKKPDIKYSFFYQMTRITKDRGSLAHDDRLDSVAIGVEHLKSVMELDSKKNSHTMEADWLLEQMTRENKHYTTLDVGGISITWNDDDVSGLGSYINF